MEIPIAIRFRFTAEEYQRYKRAYASASRTPLDWFEADSVVLWVLMFLVGLSEVRSHALQFVTVAAAVYVFLIRNIWYKRGLKRALKEFSTWECDYVFSVEEIVIRRPECIVHYDWSGVRKVLGVTDGIVFFLLREDECIWIPKMALNDLEKNRLNDLLKSKGYSIQKS